MKKSKLFLTIVCTFILALSSLTGCSLLNFDAAGYVKSVLDANYLGKFEDYAEFRNISVEEAEKEIALGKDSQIALDLASVGGLSEEGEASYRDLLDQANKMAKYEVKEAKKGENGGYIVTVEVEPSNFYQTLETNSTAIAQEKVEQGLDLTDKEILEATLIESIQKSIDENSYGEPVTMEVSVAKDGAGAYALSEADTQALADALFPQ